MAKLIPCKACKHMISKSAKTCPNCGQSQTSLGKSIKGLAGLFIVGLIVFAAISGGEDTPNQQEAGVTPDQQPMSDEDAAKKAALSDDADTVTTEDCQNDIQCWGERAIAAGSYDCTEQVERHARHDLEWTDGWLEGKFSHFRWVDQNTGTITLIGDKIMFQNGFGAFTNMIYECDWNQTTETLVDVRVREGRI
ncbi:hypothetical protein [Paracoccus sp. ME4]|uniref:hypothetical protein n=1 Tax=Paracoccus sp. ME4 TaxID=3138066 RepID=UPI00398A60D3